MILYLIRHGEPDYTTDTLTEEGWIQAKAVSDRLAVSGIDEIHASPMGRARQTAQPTAERLGLPVIIEPWAYELGEESETTYPDGISKGITDLPNSYLHDPRFRNLPDEIALKEMPGLNDSPFPQRYQMLCDGLDGMLEKLGYRRNERGLYQVIAPNKKHVALFCHAAMQRVLMAHIYHIPFHLTAATLFTHYTGISCIHFSSTEEEICPELFCYGDVGHLYREAKPLVHYRTKSLF